MNPEIAIRSETKSDIGAITEVTIAAFKTLEISNHTEQLIIEALRAAKALTLSLVAEVEKPKCQRLLFGRASAILQKIWI